MRLFFAGLDHTSAAVAVRECLAFSPTSLVAALERLTDRQGAYPALLQEAVILSTCNRVEVYGVVDDVYGAEIENNLVAFLSEFHHLPAEQFASSLSFAYDEGVAEHLFETAAGLRSLVLGEAQIQGQVRKAFCTAQRVRSIGPVLSRLFSRALTAGKRVRRETGLGDGAASVSQASIELAERRMGYLEGRTVLLVGSGKVSELAAQNLLAHGAEDLIVVNRTYENACELAKRYDARVYPYEDLSLALAEADIVISSTSAPGFVLCPDQIRAAVSERALHAHAVNGPDLCPACGMDTDEAAELLLIDLAVPRDIDPAVTEIPGVHLLTVDDLHELVNDTMSQRFQEVEHAHHIVSHELDEMYAWLRSQQFMPVISNWRQQAEALRDAECQRALRHLGELSPEQQHVVEAFSRSLVNKLLHTPTLRTREAAAAGNGQYYADMLRDLWQL